MATYYNKNQRLSPFDPDYDSNYDPEEDYLEWEAEQERRAEYECENR